MDTSQIISVAIFVVAMIAIMTEKVHRALVAITGAMLLLILHIMPFETAIGHIDFNTLGVLFGMMLFVAVVKQSGVIEFLAIKCARVAKGNPWTIMVLFVLLTAVLSAFLDNVTTVLLIGPMTITVCRLLDIDPVPFFMTQILASNIGGTATLIGDPPNIILGTSLGLSFWDFLQNNGIICLAGLGLALVYFYVCFHNKLKRREKGVAPELWEIDSGDAIPNHRIFRVRVGLFAAVVLLIATHTLTGLTMPSIGILAAGATLCTTKYPWGLLKQVEWKTLGFLVGLFLTVSGLEQTGLLNGLAQVLAKLAGGHPVRTVVVLIWFVAIASAFVDNVPMAAVMVPVLLSLADTLGMDLQTLTWTVSKGTDIGGIATPIGASANVTGVAVAAREGAPIGWKRYCKYALPASVLVLLLSMTMILLMH